MEPPGRGTDAQAAAAIRAGSAARRSPSTSATLSRSDATPSARRRSASRAPRIRTSAGATRGSRVESSRDHEASAIPSANASSMSAASPVDDCTGR